MRAGNGGSEATLRDDEELESLFMGRGLPRTLFRAAASSHAIYQYHGTRVAGLAGARGNNSLGVSGVAYESKLVALRLVAAASTDFTESAALAHRNDVMAALAHRNDVISVKNNGWDPADDGMTVEGPRPLALAALPDGVVNGRNGKGSIYVWARGKVVAWVCSSH